MAAVAGNVSDRFWHYSAVLCVTVAVCYYKAMDCGFVFDDVSAVIENKDLRPKTAVTNLFFNDFWGTPMIMEKSHKSYRPLCVLTFRFNYGLSELEPMSYHLLNVILHAVVCIMYMKMCQMFVHLDTSFVAAMLFAVHPIHTEAVTGVVGRAEVLSSIFFIGALMTYSQCTGHHKPIAWNQLFMTIVLVGIAMLCKEVGITVIGVCVIYELFVAQRAEFKELWKILMEILLRGNTKLPQWLIESIIRSAVLVGSTAFLMVARITVMGAQLPVFTKFDNPASVSPTPARQLTYNYLLPINFWLLLDPSDLCCDWTMGTIPLIESFLDHRNVITILFYVFLAKLVYFALSKQGKTNRNLLICLALMVFPFIPASNLFFPVGFVVAERILYTPSMGFCMLVAIGFEKLLENKKNLKCLLWLLISGLLLSHALKTYTRNIDWTSEYTLFRSALKVNQHNAKLWNNVGHALEKEERFTEALEYFKKAVSVQPNDIGAHMNVGRTYKNLNMFDEATKAYELAKALFPPPIPGTRYTARVAPSHLNVFLNLAALYGRNSSRLLEADALLKQSTDMRPDYVQGYINRGDIYMKLGRQMDAIAVYEQALKYEPNNADVHYNLGVVQMELGNKQKAYEQFERALVHDPDHWQSLYNSAVMIQEEKMVDNWQLAIDRFNLLMKKDKNDSRPPFSLAMLAMDMNDFLAAEKYFKLALEIEPTFKSALFNIALMLNNNQKKPFEAVHYVRKLLQVYPDHTKGIMLLGELNVNFLKNLDEAEQCFKKVLELETTNIEAMHNLCVVYVERGDLLRAEKCLATVHSLAPTEEYILRHLHIVRARIKEYMDKQKVTQAQKAAQQGQQLPEQHLGQGQQQGSDQLKEQGQGQTQQQAPGQP